jgi:hypothetical protein
MEKASPVCPQHPRVTAFMQMLEGVTVTDLLVIAVWRNDEMDNCAPPIVGAAPGAGQLSLTPRAR